MKQIIDWNSIEVKGNRSGSKRALCPNCSADRRKSKDPCLSVNFDKGLANCHNCQAVSFRENNRNDKIDSYTPPPQDWQNYTQLSDNLVKWCKQRGIPQRTLIDFRITEEKQWLPQTNREENCIVFNYFEGDTLVNKKCRDGRKNFTQSKDGKKLLYNINSAIGAKELYIVEGECFDKDAEILTQNGWMKFSDLNGTEKVGAVSDDSSLNFVKPKNLVKKRYDGNLVKYSNGRGNFTSITTPEHNLVYVGKNGLEKIKAKDVNTTQRNIPRTTYYDGIGVDLSDDLIRLYVAISADFTIRKEGDIYGCFKKKRKVERISSILEKTHIRHTITEVKNDMTSVFIHRGQNIEPFKIFPSEWIGRLSARQIELILEEVILWDGNFVNNRTMKEYNSKEKSNIDFIQTLCHMSGRMSTICKRKNERGEWYKATILQKKVSTITKKNRSEIEYSDYVYCVTVDTGMILVRQNDNITISGNCDVLAMSANGIDNVVSLCNGANDHDEQWVNSQRYLDDVERFIIAVDNDPKGIEVREKIAHRLGKWRCSYIEWTDKDANGSLLSGEIDSDIRNAIKFPVSGTHTVKDLEAGIFDLYDNGLPKTIRPKHRSFDNVNTIFSVMKGHLVTVTGIPSHGKSNYVEWYVLNLLYDYDFKASFFSPEHTPMSLHQTNFLQKAVGRNFWKDDGATPRITKADISRYTDWANEKIYITAPEKGNVATWDWLIDKFKEQLYSYGINIFVIDAFNKVQMPSGNRLENINDVLTKLTAFAQTNDCIIFLVAHPTKMKKEEDGTYLPPTLYDVSGSADFRNQTHDGFTIHRHFGEDARTEFVSTKVKYQFQGEIGNSASMEYDVLTSRYYELGQTPPRFDMTLPIEEQELQPVTAMKPNEDFYYDEIENEEAPF